MPKRTMQPSVLIVEDDQSIITLLSYTLEKAGYYIRYTTSGEEALIMVDESKPDLVLADWMLPDISGVEICRRLRSNNETKKIPIMIISARGEEGDKIEGLDCGADDYIVKPFSPRELLSRINAVFRRIRPAFVAEELSYGQVHIDTVTHVVTFRDRQVKLGPTEYKLLQSLLEHPKRVLSRDQLIRRVWGNTMHVETRTVDVHINRLRKSLGMDRNSGTYINTIRSSGYCIKDAEEEDKDFTEVSDSEIVSLDPDEKFI